MEIVFVLCQWDCSNNEIFETKDIDKQLTIQIKAKTKTKLISILIKQINIKQLVDNSITNYFILIVDPIKNEDDEEALLNQLEKLG